VRVLFGTEQIAEAVERLAREVAADYSGKPLLLLGVLKGALYVTVDLARALAAIPDGPSEIVMDFISVSSYGNAAESSGEVRVLMDVPVPVAGRNVLIFDDVADGGLTLQRLQALLQGRGPASLRAGVLFDKPARRTVDVSLDYVGLTLPDTFAVGYGLDYQEKYRTLPYLAELPAEL
jgi:hypoxanthine phosphoribosyltransferase